MMKRIFLAACLFAGVFAILYLGGCEKVQPARQIEAKTQLDRAITFQNNNQIDKAVSCYSKAIELNPGLVASCNDRRLAYFYKGRNGLAIAEYNLKGSMAGGLDFGMAQRLASIQWRLP
jgi:tetratricopeptide (TPR) repeat protein